MSVGQVSPDGNWVWNGVQWVPNPPAQPAYFGGFWRRAAALLIDGIVVSIPATIVRAIVQSFFGAVALGAHERGAMAAAQGIGALLGLAVQLAVPWLYAAFMISSSHQATLGQLAMGIKVTDLVGSRISFARATGRYFATYLGTLLCFIGGYLFMFFNGRQQTLQDIIASTVVVRRETAPGVVPAPGAGSGGGSTAAVVVVLAYAAILVFVSIIVLVILLTMGGQLKNVFSNVVIALNS